MVQDLAHKPADWLEGKLLIAMPTMGDPRFTHTVTYMCAHSEEGAMGLVINRLVDHIDFPELLDKLEIGIDGPIANPGRPVHFGGPVETGRGFVLHTADFEQESTLKITSEVHLTATVDILRQMADGRGPNQALFALGYAGWGPGQLEHEIEANGWLHCDADLDLLFAVPVADRWQKALAKLGVDPTLLSADAGHA